MNTIACLFFLTLRASAHEGYPIYPVRATIRVEPDRVIAELRTDSIFWIEQVAGLHPMPAQNWPDETRSRIESYVNSHFRLSADGNALSGRLARGRYRQLPWETNEEGVFFLRMEYPGLPAGASLTGTASFFEEYRREMDAEYRGRTMPSANDYRTIVDIPGGRPAAFTLTADAPSFSVSADEARRAPFAMSLESLRLGAEAALGMASGFPAVLAIALCLGASTPGRTALAVLLASASCGFVAGEFLDAPSWLIWSATLGAALAAGRGKPSAFMGAAAVAAAALAWRSAAAPLRPHVPLAVPFAAAGALGAGAALLLAARLGEAAVFRAHAEP
ncbi:MAG: hypothetical protein NUW21_14370, partial [Elusimicrobia bacterium]|nr:hypothetical protein [Elusimicrobiota bacterium]